MNCFPMKSHGGATTVSDLSSPKKPISRQVSSRFLSPKHKSYEIFRGPSRPDRILLSRQRSCTESSYKHSSTRENKKPGSKRYTGMEQRNDNRVSVNGDVVLFDYSSLSYMSPTVSSEKHGIQRRWSGINRYKKSESGVGNILSRGVELLKGKKSSALVENVHQLRMLHNRLVQWRYVSVRAEAVNKDLINQAQCSLRMVWNGLMKLRHSVLQKKQELQRVKLEMKLNYIIYSQIKGLENWGNMEPLHQSVVHSIVDHLHYVVCRVPLVDGAKVESQSASVMVRRASDLAESIELILTTFTPMIEKRAGVVGELATVVTQEKLLLDECFELFINISILEIQERSLKSSIMQLRLLQTS